jgi:hypothetical protein
LPPHRVRHATILFQALPGVNEMGESDDSALQLTRAETTVLGELVRREKESPHPRLADAYRRLLQLARSNDSIDAILVAHLVREILSSTPSALGIGLPHERLAYENVIEQLSQTWPGPIRALDPPAAILTMLRRLLDDHDRASGRARAGPHALLAREDPARSGFVPTPSIDRWIELATQGAAFAHRLRKLDRELPEPIEVRHLADELTATLLASIAPFYTGIKELDVLLELQDPTEADAERAAPLLRTPEQYAYFFDRANSQWLKPLSRVRRLLTSPPDLVDVGGGFVRTPDWPQGRFLVRVAPSDPDAVLKVVEKVRGTTNPIPVALIVKVALALPLAHAAQLVGCIRPRMSTALVLEYAGLDAASLAQSLALGGHPEAGTSLLMAVIDAAITNPRDSEWYLEQILGNPLDTVVQAGGDIGRFLRKRLVGSVNEMGTLRRYSTMMLGRIDRRPRYGTDKVWFLANALLRVLLTARLEPAKTLTSDLLADRGGTLARVGLAAVAQRADLIENADPILLASGQFDDSNSTRYEFRRALRVLWNSASPRARQILLSYAEAAEEAHTISEQLTAERVADAPTPDELRRLWRSRLLFRIRDAIPSDWSDRLGPLDEVDDEGPPEPTVETVTPVSPLSEDELAAIEPEALIKVFLDWEVTETRWFDSPSAEGLAIAAATAFVSRVQEFSTLGSRFATVQPQFIGAITSAVEQGLRDDQIASPAAAVSFVLGLGAALIPAGGTDPWLSDIKRNIAEVITHAARKNLLDETTSITALGMLRLLLEVVDPMSASEDAELEGRHETGMLALNGVRGPATTAMIELLLLARRRNRSELADEVAAALRETVAGDYSRSIRAAIGIRLPWLLDQDAEHRSQWLTLLFDVTVPEVAKAATWDAYLLYSTVFKTTVSLLGDQYAASVARLEPRIESDPGRRGDRDERLGIHVAMAHLTALPVEAEGGWLTQYYDRAHDWLRARVTRWIAEQAASEGSGPDVRRRARAFLRNRISRDDEPMEDELRAIGWVARTHDSDDEVLEQIILPALVRTGGATDDETGVVDLIARRADTEPVAAAKALQLLVAGDSWHALPRVARIELRRALEVLTVNSDADAREISKSIVHTLGALGFHEYRDLISDTELE